MEKEQLQAMSTHLSKLQLCEISKRTDLLKCQTIRKQVKENGEKNVIAFISVALLKLAAGLNIKLSNFQVETLCEDIIEVYHSDSLEDVREVLKKARQGRYSFGHHARGSITMGLIGEWMSQHLEEKARLREQEHQKIKMGQDSHYANVDYEAFKKRMNEPKKETKDEKEDAYRKFKAEFYKKQQRNR